MVVNTALAITSFILYSVGCVVLVITNIAIAKHTEWQKKPGLLLILSLGICDTITCLRGFVGTVEHFLNRQLWLGSADLLGVVGNFFYACSSYHMILLAYNRFIGICMFWKFERYAGNHVTMMLIALAWFTSLVYCIVHRFVLCCNVVWDFQMISSRYAVRNETNVMLSVDMIAYSYCTTVIPSVFYVFVFARLLALQKSNSGSQNNNNRNDVKLCIQFFIIIAVYVVWNTAWYVNIAWVKVVSLLGCLNCIVNPFVYLMFNKTIKKAVRKLLKMNNDVAPVNGHGPQIAPMHGAVQVAHF